MNSELYISAIEVGSSKIRGALASVDPNGIINILAVQDERVADSVRYGHVKNIEEISNKVEVIRLKLENARAILPRKISGVYVGLSGGTIGSSLISKSISLDNDTVIDATTIDHLKSLITSADNGGKDIYDLLPYEFIVDNESTLNPVGRVGHSVKGTFSVIQGAPSIKNNLNRVFADRLSLPINGFIVSPIAQASIILTPDEKQLGCIFVDFGCETTTVAIYKKGVLRYLATLPMGSRNITRDLVTLNHLEEHAESIKRSIGIVNNDNPASPALHAIDQPQLNSYISARAGEIVANVIANIEYAGLTPADLPSGFIITGGGARLKGLSDLIASQSNMKVRIGSAPRNIRISDPSIDADDVIDVIALIIAAADNNPVDCLSPVIIPDYDNTDRRSSTTGHEDDDNDDISRIGRDDDDDDDDDLIAWQKNKNRAKDKNKSRFKSKPEKSRPSANNDDDDDDDDDSRSSSSIADRIKRTFSRIFTDDEADRYDEDS